MKRKSSAVGKADPTIDAALVDPALVDPALVDAALVDPGSGQGLAHVVVGRFVPLVQSSAVKMVPLAQQAAGKVAPLTASAAERLNAAAVLISPYATSAVGRVTPLAVTAAGRVVPLAQAAAGRVGPLATSAAERVAPLTQQAVERVTPFAQHAADLVTPYAHQAAERVTPLAQQAADLVTPYAAKVGPLAAAARERGVQGVQDAVEAVGPKLEDALSGVAPAVEAARSKVTDDLLPRVGEAFTAAATAPVVVEATKRGKATMAAVRGDLTLPEPAKPRSKWLPRIAIIVALAGVAVVVVRRLLGTADAGWQSARPSTPYVPTTPPSAARHAAQDNPAPTDAASADSAAADPDTGSVEDILPTDAVEPAAQTPVATELVEDSASAVDAGASADRDQAGSVWTEGDVAAPRSDSTYPGFGAYVGAEPPEGFLIKGNERSMKYHTPESSGYSETKAEVWFSSEEAAEEAGFVRAQG